MNSARWQGLVTGLLFIVCLAPATLTAQQTAVTLFASSPAILGQPVTLTAVVTPTAAAGRVTFYDGVSILGVRPLANGPATLTTTLLGAGAHSLKAYFSGGGSFLASTSTMVGVTVTAYPSGTFAQLSAYNLFNAQNVVVGDFNGGGRADFVVGNPSAGGVSVFLGNGDSSFQTPVYSSTNSSGAASFVAVGDFNGDGKADLAVAIVLPQTSGNLKILLGNGDGSFQPPIEYSSVDNPQSILVGDVNGDGKADLVVVSDTGFAVWSGRGDGTFQPGSRYPIGSFSAWVLGDFNGDGKVDIAVATGYGSLSNEHGGDLIVLLGNGDGTFQGPMHFPAGVIPRTLVAGDFNGDGKVDLAASDIGSSGFNMNVLLGNGDGTFQAPVSYVTGFNANYVLAIDLNGDGKLDLAIRDRQNHSIGILLGSGDGTFQPVTRLGVSGSGTGGLAFAAGDFNSDGRVDLVLSTGAIASGGNVINIQIGEPLPASAIAIASTPNPSSFGQGVTLTVTVSPAAATGVVTVFDGAMVIGATGLSNGQAQFTTRSLTPGLHSLRAVYNGDSNYSPSSSAVAAQTVTGAVTPTACTLTSAQNPSTYGQNVTLTATVAPSSAPGSITFYDGATLLGAKAVVNGQAALRTTLLETGVRSLRAYYSGGLSFASSTSALLAQTVNAQPANGFRTPVNSAGGGVIYSMAVGDFNADGRADLVVASNGEINLLLGVGDGTFQSPVILAGGSASPPHYSFVAVGDFNGDGKLDIAGATIYANGPEISILLGNGDGTFRIPVNYPTGTSIVSMVVTDLNGDGNADIVFSDPFYLTVNVLAGNGDGSFQFPVVIASINGAAVGNIVAGDFNRDGSTDLAVANENGVAVLLGNGNGTFQTALNYGGFRSATAVALGDFNGDGRPDIVTLDANLGVVHVMLDIGDGTFQPPASYTVSIGNLSNVVTESLVVGDFNGDGYADIAVQALFSTSEESLTLLLGNGNGTFRQGAANNLSLLAPLVVADFNGDGRTDIAAGRTAITAGTQNTQVSVLMGDVATQLRFATPPINAPVGPIEVQDAVGNIVAEFMPRTVTVTSTPAGFSATATALNGIVSYSQLTFSGAPGTYTMAATSPGLTPATSSAFTIGNSIPSLVIDSPTAGTVLTAGTVVVTGWAIDNTALIQTPITSVKVLVDGVVVGNATYGVSRPDVCAAYPGRGNCPNVGYAYVLNTSSLSAGIHTITVAVTDADSVPDVATASVQVTTTNAPSPVVVDSPLDGSVLSGVVTVSGWAIESLTTVGRPIFNVRVILDGLVVGYATYGANRADVCTVYPGRPGCPNVGFSYPLDTTRLAAGPHSLMIVAVVDHGVPDNGLPIGSRSIMFTVPSSPPRVFIENPTSGATVSGIVTVSGWAIDSTTSVGTAISGVVVKVDGASVGNAVYGVSRPDVCGTYPGRPGCPKVGFTYALDTSKLTVGSHTLSVVATDSDGNPDSGSSTVTFQVPAPPTVFIDSLAPGALVSGTVTVAGWAVDSATAIGSVQVLVDGAVTGIATYGQARPDVCAVFPGRPGCPNVGFTFQLNTMALSAGAHTITVVARDTDGIPDTGSYSLNVTVASPSLPAVYVDSLAPGATVSGVVTVSGWALDSATAIGSVQVKVDGTLMGTATYGISRPDVCAAFPGRPGCPNVGFTFQLNTAGLSAGAHILTVVAKDTDLIPDLGSYSLNVTIPPPPLPMVYVDSLASGATVSGTITVSGWAIDNATAISGVQVQVDGAVAGNAIYGIARPDVCAVYPGRPGCPNVGFTFQLNTASLSAGNHTISVVAMDTDLFPDAGSFSLTVRK